MKVRESVCVCYVHVGAVFRSGGWLDCGRVGLVEWYVGVHGA